MYGYIYRVYRVYIYLYLYIHEDMYKLGQSYSETWMYLVSMYMYTYIQQRRVQCSAVQCGAARRQSGLDRTRRMLRSGSPREGEPTSKNPAAHVDLIARFF